MKELTQTPTHLLVDELRKREGVREMTAEPHTSLLVRTESHDVECTGPAVILVIQD